MTLIQNLNVEIILAILGIGLYLLIIIWYSKRLKNLIDKHNKKEYNKLNNRLYDKTFTPESFSPIHRDMHKVDENIADIEDTQKNLKTTVLMFTSILVSDLIIHFFNITIPPNIDYGTIFWVFLIIGLIGTGVYTFQVVQNEVFLRKR